MLYSESIGLNYHAVMSVGMRWNHHVEDFGWNRLAVSWYHSIIIVDNIGETIHYHYH